jgi:N-dimethylarginine dimethylaminohydrolase
VRDNEPLFIYNHNHASVGSGSGSHQRRSPAAHAALSLSGAPQSPDTRPFCHGLLMSRLVAMGDPRYFSVRGGANPHTRDRFGRKKRVDPELARRQWHQMARALIDYGAEVVVIEAHPKLSGLVYPANAGFLYPLSNRAAEVPGAGTGCNKRFYLSNLLPTRASEREIYRAFIGGLGYETVDIKARFEGEADFFPAGDYMLFTYGRIQAQRFVPHLGFPPWRRIYGFRSEFSALKELSVIAKERRILALELVLETHYHGDTALCSFGPSRRFLLAYLEALSPASRERVKESFGENMIALSAQDAMRYAANAFQLERDGKFFLFVPQGLSSTLLYQIRERGVEPIAVDVSEFMAKGGGSVKCMILDLGPINEQPSSAQAQAFRAKHSYRGLYRD